MKNYAALAAVLALFAGSAVAAQTGELWEVSSVMDIPGMPAGMGSQKSQVCRDKSEPPTGRKDCTVSNVKRSGLTETMTVSCPGQGDMTMEMTYNASHTEYTGVMHAQSGKRDMTIKTSGKKLGACDPAEARAANDEKRKAVLTQLEQQKAETNATIKRENESIIATCAAALESMRPRPLSEYKRDVGRYPEDPNHKNPLAPARAKCQEDGAEFCKRFQTQAGFMKTRRDERAEAGQLCSVSPAKLRASLCSVAVKSEDFAFAGAECLAESASLGEKYCGGLDYTAVTTNKRTGKFCGNWLAYKEGKANEKATQDYMDRNEQEAKTPSGSAQSGSATRTSATPSAGDAAAKAAGQTTDAATEAVNQGLNKLKGLFGR